MDKQIATMMDALMEREGGYAHHPADKGGPTKFGITQKTYARYLGRAVTADEVKNLAPETAREIYYTFYYLQPRLEALPAAIQPLMLDMSVHHGPAQAVKLLQRVVNLAGIAKLAEDGICGAATQKAALSAHQKMGPYLINALVDERLTLLRHIVGRSPSQLVFLRGWESRAESFRVGAA